MRRVICQAIRANSEEGGPTLKEFWNAVNNIGESWAEIKESEMHVGWMSLFPELVQGLKVLMRLLKMPQKKLFILRTNCA